ncbi:MAG: thiamine-phosphate kinase [Acidobacteriota bacterium]
MRGEDRRISWIRRQSQNFPAGLQQAIGDDCAVWTCPDGEALAVSTDVLVEEVHFRRRLISPNFLGRKSLLVSLSDLAAVGARPYACLLGLSLPANLSESYFHAFLDGFLEEARVWKSPLVGGDLSRSPVIHVAVTAWGCLETGTGVYRSTARAGDAVLLVGDLGLSHLGLEILKRERPGGVEQLGSEEELVRWAGEGFRQACLRAHFLPRPQIGVGVWLRERGLANAMIDVSDGLATDLMRIARASQLEAELRVAELKLPQSELDEKIGLDAVLNGGEDYALLFTASKDQMRCLETAYPPDFPPFRIIGSMKEGCPALFLSGEKGRGEYEPRGFDHFQ